MGITSTSRPSKSEGCRVVGISTKSLFLLLILASLMFPYASLRFYPYEYNPTPPCFSSSAETPGIQFKCPEGWTVARCLKRQQEFSSQMVVNNQIHREMIVAAQQRANRDVYRRKQPQRLQQEHAEYYRRVHQALGLAEGANNVSQYFMPWKNFSHNSFADFSVLGFPKAGTSQLYKLLVSHSQTGKLRRFDFLEVSFAHESILIAFLKTLCLNERNFVWTIIIFLITLSHSMRMMTTPCVI